MAYFHLLRHKPWLNPKLINTVKEGAKTSAHSFKIILGKPSGPTDLLTLMVEGETSPLSQRAGSDQETQLLNAKEHAPPQYPHNQCDLCRWTEST